MVLLQLTQNGALKYIHCHTEKIRFRETICTKQPMVMMKCIPMYNNYSVIIAVFIIIESVDSIIESVDSISRDELDVPLTQYITNA